MKKVALKIGGMSCSACSNGLEKHLNKQPGIIQASVNLVLQNATIEYDDDITMDDLTNYIKRAGFENLGIYKFNESKEHQNKTKILIIYGILSCLYLYVSMGHMIHLPVPDFINMELNPKIYGITLLILTIPYLILGFNIFKNGIKNIIAHLGSENFRRIKIGVGAKPNGWDLADFVLSRFAPNERKSIDEAIDKSCEAIKTILNDSFEKAMNLYNN